MTILETLKQLLQDGKIARVTFTKKDGTTRVMVCRRGVVKHLKGGALAFNPDEKGLLPVFDMEAQGYRMINANTLIEVKAHGETINF